MDNPSEMHRIAYNGKPLILWGRRILAWTPILKAMTISQTVVTYFVFVYRAGNEPREGLARRLCRGISIWLTLSMEKESGS